MRKAIGWSIIILVMLSIFGSVIYGAGWKDGLIIIGLALGVTALICYGFYLISESQETN